MSRLAQLPVSGLTLDGVCTVELHSLELRSCRDYGAQIRLPSNFPMTWISESTFKMQLTYAPKFESILKAAQTLLIDVNV